MRTLAPDATTAKNANTGSPINLLRIALVGGTVYYSDRDIRIPGQTYEAKVMTWGELSYVAHEDGHSSVTMTGLSLSDPDKSLLSSLESVQWQRITAQIYQGWTNVHDDDKVLLLEGIIVGPLTWDENERTVSFDIIDVATKWDEPIGTLATREILPEVAPEDEGRMIPIVYGEAVKRVKAVAGRVGVRGRLLRDCDYDDTTLYIEGWEEKTPGTSLTLRIGDEVVTGNIDGTTLSSVVRGGTITEGRASATQSASEFQSVLTDVSGFDAQYVGMWLRINVPKDTSSPVSNALVGWTNRAGGPHTTQQNKRIIGFEASTGRLSWEGGQFISMSTYGIGSSSEAAFFGPIVFALGVPFFVPQGKLFAIVTVAAAHSAGEEIIEHQSNGVVYILADHPCNRVRGVWVKGQAKSSPGATASGRGTMPLLSIGTSLPPASQANTPTGESTVTVKDSWRGLSSRDYSVNLNDSTTFPLIGHAITTIRLNTPPTFNRSLGAKSEEIWSDLEGVHSANVLIQHPLDAVEDLVTNYGPGAGDLDTSLSGATVKDKTRHLRVRFALTEQRPLMEICSHLAFLCRCRLFVTDNAKMAAQYLTHWGDATRATVNDDKIALDSLILGWREFEELVTRVRLAFQEHGIVRHRELDDTVEQATYGVRQRDVDLSWLADEDMARWVAQFWLDRWKRMSRTADLATGLQTQELQVGDQIDLFRDGLLDTAPISLDTAPAVIDAITQEFGIGAEERPDLIRHHVRLPLWPGCATSCEAECQTGCESQCEAHCQAACQTGCEESCQTTCQAVCELACETSLELVCGGGCQANCMLGCENTCTGSNQVLPLTCDVAACETDCMAVCEVQNEAVCNDWCEANCQNACDCACQIMGEPCTGVCECKAEDCDLSCQMGGQDPDRLLCEVSCQVGCEAGEGCESEEVCEETCQAGCNVSTQ